MKVLMVEDSQAVTEMMAMFFEKEGWTATFRLDGKDGLATYMSNPKEWDLVILDLNLPSMDGMQICREMRKISAVVPIIMLTAKDSESDQIIGLSIGADDYVTKPFSPITLIARMKALHRRADLSRTKENKPLKEQNSADFDIALQNFRLSTKTREVYIDNQLITGLTPKEFELLYTLAKKPKQVFSREQLLSLIWDYQYFGDERTVDAHIKKLRKKIEVGGKSVIHTVWGVGYKFDDTKDDE